MAKILDRKLNYFRVFFYLFDAALTYVSFRIIEPSDVVAATTTVFDFLPNDLEVSLFSTMFLCTQIRTTSVHARAAVSDDSNNLFARVFLDVFEFGQPPENKAN